MRGVGVQVGKLIEYNTSCVPMFVQRAGLAAVQSGEPVIRRTLERFPSVRGAARPEPSGERRDYGSPNALTALSHRIFCISSAFTSCQLSATSTDPGKRVSGWG